MVFYRLFKIFNTETCHRAESYLQIYSTFLTLSMSLPTVTVLPQHNIIYDMFTHQWQ